MRAPDDQPRPPAIRIDAPPGWYAIDAYAACFEEVGVPSDGEFDPELEPGPYLAKFRWDVARVVRLAWLRAKRDDVELPRAGRDAAALLEALETMQPTLDAIGPLLNKLAAPGGSGALDRVLPTTGVRKALRVV